MVMIMFRAAMYPIKEPSDDDLKLESEDGGPTPADDDDAAAKEEEEKPVIY